MKTKTLLKISSIFAIVVAVGAGCSKGEAPPQPQSVPVVAVQVEPTTIEANYTSVAQTEGSLEVEVRARVSGIMDKFMFKEGGTVKQGQQLFQIDPRPYRIALQQAQAQYATAEAALDQATKNWERIEPLYAENAVSKKDYDDAQAALNTAKASMMMAKANVDEARLNLIYTRVEAPISGIASKSIPSRGTLVSAQQTLLTRVSKIDPIYVNFSFSDQSYMRMQREIAAGKVVSPDGRLTVTIRLPDGTVYPMDGVINFQDISIDTGTSTIPTRAELPNPDHALRPGLFVEATVRGMTRPNAIIVPQRAVMTGENGKFLYVINEKNQAEIREVVVGDWYEDHWIVNEGLKGGEKVIVDGISRLGPGAPVAARMISVRPGESIEAVLSANAEKEAAKAGSPNPAQAGQNGSSASE